MQPLPASLRYACDLPRAWLEATYRGWDRSEAADFDLAIIPDPPNFMGSPTSTSHSGPFGFLQRVPLIFYGPGHVASRGPTRVGRSVTLADVAPTYASLVGFDFPTRSGRPLDAIVKSGSPAPRVIVTVVIDGGGWNVLEEWPGAWPYLARLRKRGTSIEPASVGSSPSITPATHSTLGTAAYPRKHGVTAIVVRTPSGRITEAFTPPGEQSGTATMDVSVSLELKTFADLWDREVRNRALVGSVIPGVLQLGMVGHGRALRGADRDIVATLAKGARWATNEDLFALPGYVNSRVAGPQRDLKALDASDGTRDGLWSGHEMRPLNATPAFSSWETRTAKTLMDREGFGDDNVTDLFFINYKAPDGTGHLTNMTSPLEREALASVDEGIGQLVRWLDGAVGRRRYVLVVTADHGQTPLGVGGFPISSTELKTDLNSRFDELDNSKDLVQDTSASTLFVNPEEARANSVAPERMASFLRRYSFEDNIPDDATYPAELEGRESERIFRAVIPGRRVGAVARCAGVIRNK